MGTCSTCEEEFEDKYFDVAQNKCILHCEKDDWYEMPYALKNWSKSDDKIKYFWQKIRAKILQTENEKILDLKNVIFPQFEDSKVTKNNKVLNDRFNFIEYNQNGLAKACCPEFAISINIDFTGAKFLDNINFGYYNFEKFICFNDVNFYGECSFQHTKFNEVSFNNCNFYKEVLFENAYLNLYSKGNRDDFINSIFHDQLKFYHTILSNEESDKLFDIDFIGTQFKRVHFMGCISNSRGLRFFKDTKAEYLSIGSIDLKELYIAGDIPSIEIHGNNKTIDRLIIKHNGLKNLLIHNCTIKGDFLLNDKRWKKDDIFELDNLNLSESIFKGKVKIQFYTVKHEAKFYNTKFEDLVDFYQTKFNNIIFERTDFKNISVFSEAKFNCDVNFKYTTFEELALFRKTIFEKTVNFEDSIFKEEANFLGMKANLANRETARIIKNSFEKQNNIIEANRFYAKEMEEREKELKKELNDNTLEIGLEYLIFKLHSQSSNHSQDWVLPILWILNIALFYSMSISTFYHNNALASISAFSIIQCFVFCRTIRLKIMLFVNLLILYSLSYIDLDVIANKVNPFSTMTGKDPITFGLLIFKITIAYLIYQFIVSVRQNTRRS